MILILNNGTRISIPKDAVQSLLQTLLSGEVKQWQCQIDASNKEITSILNLKEVSAICHEADIIRESGDAPKQIGLFLDTLSVDDAHGRFWAEKFRRFVVNPKLIE